MGVKYTWQFFLFKRQAEQIALLQPATFKLLVSSKCGFWPLVKLGLEPT